MRFQRANAPPCKESLELKWRGGCLGGPSKSLLFLHLLLLLLLLIVVVEVAVAVEVVVVALVVQ